MLSAGEGRPTGREESSCLHFSCLATYMNFISQMEILGLKCIDTITEINLVGPKGTFELAEDLKIGY